MERSEIDKIDTKRDAKELIDLYHKIELMSFVKGILYEHYVSQGTLSSSCGHDDAQADRSLV
jgi:hypothetical protein